MTCWCLGLLLGFPHCTLIRLLCRWAWPRQGYWRYRSLIDWLSDWFHHTLNTATHFEPLPIFIPGDAPDSSQTRHSLVYPTQNACTGILPPKLSTKACVLHVLLLARAAKPSSSRVVCHCALGQLLERGYCQSQGPDRTQTASMLRSSLWRCTNAIRWCDVLLDG